MRGRRGADDEHVELGVVVAAALLPGRSIGGIIVPICRGVYAEFSPDEEALVEPPAQGDIVGERVILGTGRVAREHVAQVGRLGDPVGVIGRERLYGIPQGLVEEELRQVRHVPVSRRIRSVVEHGRVGVCYDVLMRSPSLVMSREQGVEIDNSVLVRRLYPSQVRRAEPALPRRADAAVLARPVAGPYVNEQVRRLTRVDVDELQLQVHRHALEVLGHVLPDLLLVHKVRPVGVVGRQRARRVGPEDLLDRRVLVVAELAREVVRLPRPLAERGGIAAVEEGGCVWGVLSVWETMMDEQERKA